MSALRFRGLALAATLMSAGCQLIFDIPEPTLLDSDGGDPDAMPDMAMAIDAEIDSSIDSPIDAPEVVRITDDIAADMVLNARTRYVVGQREQIIVKSGATLTIEPGTRIEFEVGAALIIARGANIEAAGTATAPIVLTSTEAADGKTRGFWGGLVVLGSAPINVNVNSTPSSNEAVYEAFSSEVPEGRFGGTNAHDDSGRLSYVRIEFPGFTFVSDRQYSGLLLGGVGDATEVDHIQVHGGADDGVEILGGTVNLRHIVSSQNQDDGIDFDNGWSGKAQFVVVQNVTPDGIAEASNGIESDNHATAASYDAQPRTQPTIYNATIIGNPTYNVARGTHGAVLRRGTGGRYFNIVFSGYPTWLEVRDLATKNQLDAGNLFIKSSIFFTDGTARWPQPQPVGDIVESPYFDEPITNNRFINPGLQPGAASLTAPDFRPAPGAAALTGGATPPGDGFFDATATFVGAVGTVDWTQGWTSYTQPVR